MMMMMIVVTYVVVHSTSDNKFDAVFEHFLKGSLIEDDD